MLRRALGLYPENTVRLGRWSLSCAEKKQTMANHDNGCWGTPLDVETPPEEREKSLKWFQIINRFSPRWSKDKLQSSFFKVSGFAFRN